MRVRTSVLVTASLLCAFGLAQSQVSKKGGIFFRVDDDHTVQEYLDYTAVLDRYNAKASFAIYPHGFLTESATLALLRDLQSRGYELQDHTPDHANSYFTGITDTTLYAGRPGVDHFNGDKACLRYAAVTAGMVVATGTADVSHDLMFSKTPGGFAHYDDYMQIYFPSLDKIGTLYKYWNGNPADIDTLQFRSAWDDPIDLGTQSNITYQMIGNAGGRLTDDALRLLAERSLQLFAQENLARPTTWVQPGVFTPNLDYSDLQRVYGATYGYQSGATYRHSALKVFNEYDPGSDRRFAMQWGNFQEETSYAKAIEGFIADGVAKHYVLSGASHFRGGLGGWSGFLGRMDSLLSWCAAKGIPVRTQKAWCDILYSSTPDPYENIIPALDTDLDGNGVPDGYLATVNGAVDRADGPPGWGNVSYAINSSGILCSIPGLAGVEKGSNQFGLWLKGPAGNAVTLTLKLPGHADFVCSFILKGDTWQQYTLEDASSGSGTLNVPQDVSLIDVIVSATVSAGGPVKVGGMEMRKPLSPATLIAPANGAGDVSTTPALSWQAVAGASAYDVRIASDAGFTTVVYSGSGVAGNSVNVSSPLAGGGSYYWEVRAAGGPWSSPWSFTTASSPLTPVLISPANGAGGLSATPALTWRAVAGDTTYDIRIASDAGFSTIVFSLSGLAATSTIVSPPLAYGGVYYWEVRETGGSWSAPWTFTTVSVPYAPVLKTPANGAGGQGENVTLAWSAAGDQDSVMVSTDSSFSDASKIVSAGSVPAASRAAGYRLAGLDLGKSFYWRVSTGNLAGMSPWSAPWTFATASPPVAPVLNSPANGATNQNQSVTLTWSGTGDQDSVMVSTESSFTDASKLVSAGIIPAASRAGGYRLSGLGQGKSYYWRVSSRNIAGTSPWSPGWTFTTAIAPVAPVLKFPANGAVDQPQSLTLVWDASGDPDSVIVSTESSFTDRSKIISAGMVLAANRATGYQPAGCRPGQSYYWRVSSRNIAGTGPWSAAWRFTTTGPPPVTVQPDNNALGVSTLPTFIWSGNSDAISYMLRISVAADFSTVTILDTLTATSYSVPVSSRLNAGSMYYWQVAALYPSTTSRFSSGRSFTTVPTPTVIYVDSSWVRKAPGQDVGTYNFGFDAFAAVQSAVDAAQPGTTIHIAPGTYNENIHVPRRLSFVGAPGAVIDGAGGEACFKLGADSVSIAGLSLRHAASGITGASNGVFILNCSISTCTDAGISLSGSDRALIHADTIQSCGDGIRLSGSQYWTVVSNYLSGNTTHFRLASAPDRSGRGGVLQANTFLAPKQWNVVIESDPRTTTISGNIFGPAGYGNYIRNTAIGPLRAWYNWYNGDGSPSRAGFSGDVDFSHTLPAATTVAVYPLLRVVPLGGTITQPVTIFVPPGRVVGGTTLNLGWDKLKTQLTGPPVKGNFFAGRVTDEQTEVFLPSINQSGDGYSVVQSLPGGVRSPAQLPCVGSLFLVTFKGIGAGQSLVGISNVVVRDSLNQGPVSATSLTPAVLGVDAAPPAVASVVIRNETLHTDQNGDGKDDFVKNADSVTVTALITDDNPLTADDIGADLTALTGGTGSNRTTASSYDTTTRVAAWSVGRARCQPADGSLKVSVTAADQVGNTASGQSSITSDNTPPTKVLHFSASPGHRKVFLAWSNGADAHLKGTLVRYARWHGYPVFAAATQPPFPSSPAAGEGTALDTLISSGDSVAAFHRFTEPDRDIYLYSAFAYDWAGNYSPVDEEGQDRATNYYLGDLGSGAGPQLPGLVGYDGRVNFDDLPWFWNLYGGRAGAWPYPAAGECDFGPTAASKAHPAGSPLAVPAPDGVIDFEDLMIFAQNYSAVAPKVSSAAGVLASEMSLSAVCNAARVENGQTVTVTLELASDGRPVKGISARVSFNAAILKLKAVTAGPLLGSAQQGLLLFREGRGNVRIDGAVLGTGRTVDFSGQFAVLTFEAAGRGEAGLKLDDVLLRTENNQVQPAAVKSEVRELPTTYSLLQNFPNPFNPSTRIEYTVPGTARVTVQVFDLLGRLVRDLVNDQREQGRYQAEWDGRNNAGRQVASGMYIYVMRAADFTALRKMLLLK